ncbi:MAG: leucine--tRNA ligase [Anaerolineae bacterium]|jgi:leucyl-tRNA synthetase|nr:leucine--tRNA ligase [Anaerolineae bacterium]MDH7474397.1 leucine--tRNA ligase [Anaerolineae bacterium]
MVTSSIDRYIPQEIEPKWQKRWEADGLYRSVIDESRPKHYALTMLPYPSGDLHIGHWYAMAPSDARARYMRMRGYNVLFPMGFDAFGLPAENAAIRHGIHPFKWTMSNIENMRRQLRSMGAMFDWEREAISCLPGYYKWTEWFFLKFYDAGLAYRKKSAVDFCPQCNTTLAREQVWGEDRHCERCGTPVIKKELEQWFFRITDYAEELLDFSQIDWPERVVTMQTNWIGRSEGAEVTFVSEREDPIVVFTTRPDTLWGATFMVLAPEHPLVDKLTTPECRQAVENYKFQAARQSEIERLSTEKEKTGVFTGAYAINPVNGERIPIWIADYVMMTYGTGAIMGVPSHDERDFEFAIKFGLPIIPVIDRRDGLAKSLVFPGSVRDGFADELRAAGIEFVTGPVGDVGEGLYVILHGDEQIDHYVELMRAYLLPNNWNEIVGARWIFIFDDGIQELNSVEADRRILARCKEIYPSVSHNRTVMEMLHSLPFYRDVLFHAEYGTMINSGPFTGTPGDVAVKKVTEWLEKQGIGKFAVNYRLRDWLISRQRYWGAPIPIVYCDKCGTVPVPYEDLPVLLPEDAEIPPSGENALKYHEGFLHTTCPRCGGPAERETDTMDTFLCSSWYQYAYLSPYYKEGDPAHSDSMPFDPKEGAYWLPVDVYTGGIEHATMHLIYTRFFTKVMRDLGLVDFDEPMLVLRNQGIILGEDSEKMSKSRGNVIAPDDLVEKYGADTVRAYLMFGWRWELGGPWDSQGIEGVSRFLERVWNCVLAPGYGGSEEPGEIEIRNLRRKVHQAIRKATEDMESFSFNTYIANLMELNNIMLKAKETPVYGTEAWEEAVKTLVLLLAPACPHIAEELWTRTGHPYSVHQQAWPVWDPEIAAEEIITLVVQVNGKVRDRIEVPADIAEEQAKELALSSNGAQRHTAGKTVQEVIYVPGRLVNIVVK